MFDFVLLGLYQVSEFLYMFVSFYTILKQRLKIFWSSTPTNFSYEPPLISLSSFLHVYYYKNWFARLQKSFCSFTVHVDSIEKNIVFVRFFLFITLNVKYKIAYEKIVICTCQQ
jgi:hypothetical protein